MGKLGEYAAALRKGAHIRVGGELHTPEYEIDGREEVHTYEIGASSRIASALTS